MTDTGSRGPGRAPGRSARPADAVAGAAAGAAAGRGVGPSPRPDDGRLAAAKAVLRVVDRASYAVVAAVMAAMAVIVAVQVFMRYVVGTSIDSADELSRLFFVWSIFLAIPHGVKYGIHVGIDLLVRLLPDAVQRALFRIVAAAGAVLMLVVLAVSWTATVDKWPELMPTLPVSAGVYYVAVLIGAGHSALHLLLLAAGGRDTWEGEAP